jgi:succinate-acetate transporter protein
MMPVRPTSSFPDNCVGYGVARMTTSTATAERTPVETRIVVRPLATPLPLGLYSFGIGMLMLAAQSAGWVPVEQDKDVGLIVASFVFPLESAAAIFAFLARDALAATVLGLFSSSWLTIGLALILGPPGSTSAALGFYLVGFAAAVGTLGVLGLSGKPLLSLILALSTTRAIIDALYEFSGTIGIGRVAGYVAAAIAAAAWYAGTAMVLEDVRGTTVLPVFRRGSSRTAIEGGLGDQLGGVDSEAGVRRPL